NSIDLEGAPLVAELSKLVDLSNPRRLASIQSDFVIKDRRITTDHFTLNLVRLPITMSGWTDLDGRIDYEMKVEGLTDRLPDRARRVLGELNLDLGSLTTLTLRGTLNQMAVQVNGVPINGGRLHQTGLRRDDRERLRPLGRPLRDRSRRRSVRPSRPLFLWSGGPGGVRPRPWGARRGGAPAAGLAGVSASIPPLWNRCRVAPTVSPT